MVLANFYCDTPVPPKWVNKIDHIPDYMAWIKKFCHMTYTRRQKKRYDSRIDTQARIISFFCRRVYYISFVVYLISNRRTVGNWTNIAFNIDIDAVDK